MNRLRHAAPASFTVLLERETLAPGDEVRGVVLIEVVRPLEEAVIAVDLRGRECIETTERGDHGTSTSDYTIWFQAMERCDVALSPDGMHLPFSTVLPTNLPASSTWNFGSRRDIASTVKIVYEVVCSLHIVNDKRRPLNEATPFTITTFPLARPVGHQPKQKAVSRTFHRGLLQKKSSCTVSVYLNSSVVSVDDPITADVTIKIEDRELIQSLSMELCRRLLPNVSYPRVTSCESHQLTSKQCDRDEFRSSTVSMTLTVPPTMLLEFGPLKPTLRFYHFDLVDDLAIGATTLFAFLFLIYTNQQVVDFA